MCQPLAYKLLQREQRGLRGRSGIHCLYGHPDWIKELDITNELGGHTGCVNALSWSRSGALLLSGSDDECVNVYSYRDHMADASFEINASIATGHTANIFCVKFMPSSGDRTLVTGAGDAQIRVFDLEYAGRPHKTSRSSPHCSGTAVKWDDYNTDCRVYRSHKAAVKSIVTETSPFHFLTCSEDGTVRQHDSRLPSDGAPPLISYQQPLMELHSISSSTARPHYIALSGGHPHCFLHDRRMLSRNRDQERGRPGIGLLKHSTTQQDQFVMDKATRCVQRFAAEDDPNPSTDEMRSITACKISDTNPNEILVSWSGDIIHKFDIIRPSVSLKQKVSKITSSSGQRNNSRPFTSPCRGTTTTMPQTLPHGTNVTSFVRNTTSGDGRTDESCACEQTARSIADRIAMIRRLLVSLGDDMAAADRTSADENPIDAILENATQCDADMRQVCSQWRYPMPPNTNLMALEARLRARRKAARHFVQAAGTLARVIKGQVSDSLLPIATSPTYFNVLPEDPTNPPLRPQHAFLYAFLRMIVLWCEGGTTAILHGSLNLSPDSQPSHGDIVSIIQQNLIPVLLQRASDDDPVINTSASRFEHDGTRFLFPSEAAAVVAFGQAIGRYSRHTEQNLQSFQTDWADGRGGTMQDFELTRAHHFWIFDVGRGLLHRAGRYMGHSKIQSAFHSHEYHEHTYGTSEAQSETDPGLAEYAVPQVGWSTEMRSSDFDNEHEFDFHAPTSDDIYLQSPSESGGEDIDANDSDEIRLDDTSTVGGSVSQLYHRDYVLSAPPTRTYRGHCNDETVKDVNFFGLDDEYVVSGSDQGYIFIWDVQTAKLLNILNGDKDNVNVLQGHPYEPILAASGIDSTIKIFSPDRQAQNNAKNGVDVHAFDLEAKHRGTLGGTRSIHQAIGLRSCKCHKDMKRIVGESKRLHHDGINSAAILRRIFEQLAAQAGH